MTLTPGTRIGRYEVAALIDEGGMGQVYRARDTSLDRQVAVKVLPPSLTDDRERLARFEREARLLASLTHPNVAAVHGLEEEDGTRALIMELVEGETLARRLRDGPLPLREALPIARQVCEALQAAHERGVVHRDLKPGNVMVRPDGRVKVLDFGLAKDVAADEAGPDSGGATGGLTRSGSLLGTPPYMSPEQLEGHQADPRTDIWSLGCLLYEMLVGRTPFGRTTAWQTVAAILEQEPDLDRLPAGTPPRIRLLVERCLRKDPRRRLHHVADARIEIEEAIAEGEASGWTASGARSRRVALSRPGTLAVLALTGAVGVGVGRALLSGPPDTGSARTDPLAFTVPIPPGMSIGPGEVSTHLAVSPDGRSLAFTGSPASSPLRVHEFRTGTTRALEGTAGAASPFWSPDGRFIGFFAEGQLKKVPRDGGPPQVVSAASWEAGNSWGEDGTILFAQPVGPGRIAIHRVPEEGGEPESVTTVAENEIGHFWPHFLPDGRHFLYLAVERSADPVPPRHLYVASLDGGERRRLLSSVSRAVYAPPGILLYATEGVLVAHPFDPEARQLVGEPRPITDRLRYFYMTGQAEFSASSAVDNPVLAFHGGAWTSEIVRYDREGRFLGSLGEPAAFDQVRISPDGRRAVVDVLDPANGGRDLWVYDLETLRSRRLTLHRADEQDPVWSPDGVRILYRSDESGPPDLYVRSADGSGAPERVLESGAVLTPQDWAGDGRHVLFQVSSRQTGQDQWVLDLGGESEPRPLLATRYTEWGGTYSPDGRWLAFVSDESGRSEVYVAPVEDPGARLAVSTTGGIGPRWSGDGGELFYVGPGPSLMAAEVRTGAEPIVIGDARMLFEIDGSVYSSSWDVSPDGSEFLVNRVIEDLGRAPIQVMMGWDRQLPSVGPNATPR